MEVEEYFSKISIELSAIQYNYIREDEGKVYLGLPSLSKSAYNQTDYLYIINYLCLFVAIDLLVYCYYPDRYPKFKKIFNIPKFEYGLTNTFYYPETIYKRKLNEFSVIIFNDAFRKTINYFDAKHFEIEIKEMLQLALSDKDFQEGKFNNSFLSFIRQNLQ